MKKKDFNELIDSIREGGRIMRKLDFIKDLEQLKEKVQDRKYAVDLYGSLCNIQWVHKSAPKNWKEILRLKREKEESAFNVWYRKWPNNIIHFVREWVIRIGGIRKLNKPWWNKPFSKLNMWLLSLSYYLLPKCIPYPDWIYSCSWRFAGEIVAELRNCGEDYLDFYCSGNESIVTNEIKNDMLKLGWKMIKYEI